MGDNFTPHSPSITAGHSFGHTTGGGLIGFSAGAAVFDVGGGLDVHELLAEVVSNHRLPMASGGVHRSSFGQMWSPVRADFSEAQR